MPSLNFKLRFADRVAEGSKRRTIRARRKRPFQVGDRLVFFTGMRTKSCRRIRADATCVAAELIEINTTRKTLKLGGKLQTARQIERLARDDGFDTAADFWAFFRATHGERPRGQMIE